MKTPWGTAQQVTEVAPGVLSVSCASHGGIKLDRKRNAMIHPRWRRAGGWYEEDCEWSIAVASLGPVSGFPADTRMSAYEAAKDWFPDEYSEVFGVLVTLSESHVLREREAWKAAEGKPVVRACWGDWHANVPTGMVGVLARVHTSVGEESYHLLTAEEYNALPRGPVRVLPSTARPWCGP